MSGQPRHPGLIRGYLAAAGVVLIWTGFILVSRFGGRSGLTAWDILALRLGTACLILLPLSRDLMSRRYWLDARLWALAMLGVLLYGVLVYAGFRTAPAAHVGILLSGLQPFLIAAVVWLLGGDRPQRGRMAGLFGIAAGIACVAVPEFSHWSAELLLGDALILGASITWALYSVLVKRWGCEPWALTRFVALSSGLLFLPVYALLLPKALEQVPASQLLLQALYQGLGPTIVAMLLFLQAVRILGAERLGALIALVPVLAGLSAAPLLGERLSPWLLAGLLFVSTGAWIAARPSAVVRS